MDTFIEVLLDRLLATSVQTALLAAVVWTLCRLVRRLSPATQCWLWWLVALQALVGLVATPIQLPLLPHAVPALSEVVPSTHGPLVPTDGVAMQPTTHHTVPLWSSVIFLLWMSGVVVMSWSTLRHWRRARALLSTSTPCVDAHLLQSLARICESRGLRRAPRLRLSWVIDSPALLGHLRPVLLLPAVAALSDAELEMALAHELTHLRRGDLWWGCIPALLRHLFFFNPFAHLAAREYAIAREADCDAAVVGMDQYSRRDYGCLLLRLGARPRTDGQLAVASPTFHALSRRLTMLQNTSFLSRAGSIPLLLAVAAVGVLPLRLVAATATATATAPASPAANPASSAASPAVRPVPRAVPAAPAATASAAPVNRAGRGIRTIDFRRAIDGSVTGRLIVGLDDARTPVKLSQQGNRVVVDFVGAALPTDLQRRFDVAEFATPVTGFDAVRTSSGALLVISVTGDFEQRAYQSGNQYVVEIQARHPAVARVDEKPAYAGERMTVNFHDIDTRTLLRLISDTSGHNIVVDDAVSGNVTIRVQNVPWDQLLDIVLATKGLSKHVQGDVIFVAPAALPIATAPVAAPATSAQ